MTIPTWAKIAGTFALGAGVGFTGTYFFCRKYYGDREEAAIKSVIDSYDADNQKRKPIPAPVDIQKEEKEKKESYAADADAYSSLTEMYTAPAKKPRKYNKRKNEDVGMDQAKLPTIHAISVDEYMENDEAGKVALIYYSKDKTLVDDEGDILWKDGKNYDPECHFEWFSDFVDSLSDTDHIYILDPDKDTCYQISKVNGRRTDFYMDDED